MKLAVLASGRGSNFEAIVNAVRAGEIPETEVSALLCNNPQAEAIERAKKLRVPIQLVGSKNKAEEESLILQALDKLSPNYICLAGYMRILSPQVVSRYSGRILNLHPSLLPAFVGLKAQRQALEHGVKWTGCTVHFVTEALDAGPILTQRILAIHPSDTEDSLVERLRPEEHQCYVEALKLLATKSYRLDGRRVIWN